MAVGRAVQPLRLCCLSPAGHDRVFRLAHLPASQRSRARGHETSTPDDRQCFRRRHQHRKDPEPAGMKHRLLITGSAFAAVIGAGGLAGLHFAQGKTGMPFASGGWLGNAVGLGLASTFSFTGATLFLLALFLSGVTIFTGLSWLKLMDSVARWGFALADWLYRFASTQIDRFIGMRARRARRETVEEETKVLEKHSPPRIEPVT